MGNVRLQQTYEHNAPPYRARDHHDRCVTRLPAQAQLDAIENQDLKGDARGKALDTAWSKLQPAMADPMLDDIDTLHQLARLALAIDKKQQPVPGKQLAAVVGEALVRLSPNDPQTQTLMPKLIELAGKVAIDRVAHNRGFNKKTLTNAVADDADAQFSLSLLYDDTKVTYSQSPVLRHPKGVIHWLEQAVESGSHDAARDLAFRYRYGMGVQADLDRAEALVRQAFREGDWLAEHELWDLFYRRRNANNRVDAPIRKELEKQVEAGEALAMHELGLMLRVGRGGPKNQARARKLFEQAYEAGITRSAVRLGSMLRRGQGGPGDGKGAETWFLKAAEQGDLIGQYYLGQLYRDGGPGIEVNGPESFKWYLKAAKAGLVDAQSVVGAMYGQGLGVPRDQAESEKWERLAAEQGDFIAAYNLAKTYLHGRGVEKDYFEAEKWLKAAERGGISFAANDLGVMYRDGKGVEQDYREAMRYFMKIAQPRGRNKGAQNAQHNVGKLYAQGLGVEQDYKEAAKWFKRAADQGYGYSQFTLGQLYEQGKGVEQNRDKAIQLYREAAKLGWVPEANQRLEELGVPLEDDGD